MQWNVLARPYTKYLPQLHRSGDAVESAAQTSARYAAAAAEILAQQADVVCLQEVEEAFFGAEYNGQAAALLEAYSTHKEITRNVVGTVVLVRKASHLRPVGQATAVEGGPGTGGDSKSCVAVRLEDEVGRAVVVVSAHLAFQPAKRHEHMARAQAMLAGRGGGGGGGEGGSGSAGEGEGGDEGCVAQQLVFCGDFNTPPDALPELTREAFFTANGLELVAPADFAVTGCGSSEKRPKVCIDYIYASPGLGAVDGSAKVGGEVGFPYAETGSPAEITSASDHSWVCAAFTFSGGL
jgi:endonuclease/exonuclease/phosphatase family metal-dependent hydrolase